MDFMFENQGTHTYFVYKIAPDDAIDSMSLGMLTHNRIAGLAETSYIQMDEARYLRYDVTSRVAVEQFFSGPVNKKRLLGVLSGIVTALLSAEDYMIDTRSILLDTRYIFADVSNCDTVVICLPIANLEKFGPQPDAATFFKNIIFSTQFDQTENCDHVAQIINFLNSSATFSPENFQTLLRTLRDKAEQPAPKPQPPVMQQPIAPQPPVMQQPIVPQPPVMQQPVAPQPPVMQQPVAPQQPVMPRPQAPVQQPAAPQNSAESGEKMSFLYLLRHYSKENAEAYKAQKNQPGSAKEPKQKKEKKSKNAAAPVGFTVPGAPEKPASFAAPNQPAAPAPQPIPQQPAYQPPRPAAAPAPAPAPMQPPVYQNAGRQMNFGETVVLGGSTAGETTVLSAVAPEAQIHPTLIRQKNGEKIPVNKPLFRLGKEKSYVDYFIADNPAVSRSHANIIERDGRFYIMDTNSKNHTYVNGVMLPSNEEVPLEHGSVVVLANESFEFKLY